jgi:hypothetical protein
MGQAGDTIGVAGALNGISPIHQAFFNAGDIGILIGDGQLPNPGLEQVFMRCHPRGGRACLPTTRNVVQ